MKSTKPCKKFSKSNNQKEKSISLSNTLRKRKKDKRTSF